MKENNSKVKSHIVYKLKDGTKVPGVTTITNILAKPALIPWAWNLGRMGIDFRKFRDDKADIGTLAHYLVMCHLKNEKPDTDDYSKKQIDQAENCLLSYFEWEKHYELKPVLVEQPLVSEKYKFGGTLDCLTRLYPDSSNTCLIDYKTGKGIYPEYRYNAAAYKLLLEEHGHKVKQAIILNIGRDENEAFKTEFLLDLEKEKEIFLHCLAIYNLRKQKGGKEC